MPMKPSSFCLPVAILAAVSTLPLSLQADIVIMKDGKKYESATILSETPDSVTFKYQLTPKIPDTRTEPKANIGQIIRQTPQELEIVPLRKLLPTPDLLTGDKYEGIIQDQLRPFVAKYPGTAEAKEVEGMIATLQAEKEKVVSGQLKMEDKWLTADEVKRDGHSIDAYRIRAAMNAAGAKGQWRDALLEWDKLIDREDGYTDTEQYVKAIPEASTILENYKKELEKMLREQPIIAKRREDSLKTLVEPDLSRTMNAIKAEVDAFKAQNSIEKRTRTRWMSVYKYDAKSIQDVQKDIVEEIAKIAVIDIGKLTTVNEGITAARRYLADQNVEQAEAALVRIAASAGRDSTSAISKLKSAITALKSELNKKRTNQRMFGGSSALTGSSEATKDDRVAKAMEEAEKEKAEKKSSGSSGGLTAGSTSSSNSKKKSSDDDEEKPKKPRRSTASADDAPVEEEGGIQNYLIYGGAALLAILLGVMFLGKKKEE